MSELVLFEQRQQIGIITLNRAEAMNALSKALREQLEQTLVECQNNPDIRVLILTGQGKAFCAGNDLKELASGAVGGTVADAGKMQLPAMFAEFKGPIIAAVNGFAVTAGFEMALACDMIIASRNAVFADTHARVGVLPGWGLSQRLPRLIGMARAKELSFTGNQISADQACEWGFVNRVVEPDQLLANCLQLAEDMCSCVPEVLAQYKQLIHDGMNMHYQDALDYEAKIGIESATSASAEAIASRRQGVMNRGRAQTKTHSSST